MELRQLRYFVAVAELGSFTKAALVLDIAQPAISRQIRDLEIELGVRLLVRNGRGAVLTDAGIKFLSRAKMILEDAERALQEARSLKGRPMGMVSIGMPPAIGGILSVPTVMEVRKLYPEIQLQLTEGYSGHIHEWLLSGRLDVGVFYTSPRNSDLNYDPLVTERLYLFGAPEVIAQHFGTNESVPFSRILKLPLILPARPHAIRRLVDEVASRSQTETNIVTEVNAFLGIRDLVVNGCGLTILPISAMLREVDLGQLKVIDVFDPVLWQTVGLMTSAHHAPSLATRTVARVISDIARTLVKTSVWPEQRLPSRATVPSTRLPKKPAAAGAR
jgi:LysR family transcriptional regulator, nitrogen assimilation regulatory protein